MQPFNNTLEEAKELYNMGGGNAQKTAKSREKHNEKADSAKNSGGGASAMSARKGGYSSYHLAEAYTIFLNFHST